MPAAVQYFYITETSPAAGRRIQCESKKSPLGDLTFFHYFTNG